MYLGRFILCNVCGYHLPSTEPLVSPVWLSGLPRFVCDGKERRQANSGDGYTGVGCCSSGSGADLQCDRDQRLMLLGIAANGRHQLR